MAKSRLEQLLEKAKNNRLLSVCLLIGIAVIALSEFTGALQSIIEFVRPSPKLKMKVVPIDTGVVLLLDVYIQNPQGPPRMATEARLVVEHLKRREVAEPYGGHVPISFQYHALMSPDDKGGANTYRPRGRACRCGSIPDPSFTSRRKYPRMGQEPSPLQAKI